MARRRPVRKFLTVAAVGGLAYVGYLVWCCVTGRDCCPFGIRPGLSIRRGATGVARDQVWGLRFTPDVDGGIRRAYAILEQPDGATIAINGGLNARGHPDIEAFYASLASALRGRRVDGMIIRDFHRVDADLTLSTRMRGDLERTLVPFVQGGLWGISWEGR